MINNIVRVHIELEDGSTVQPFHSISIKQGIAEHSYFELKCPMDTFEEGSEPLLNASIDLFGKIIKVVFQTGPENESTEYFFKGIITEIAVDKFQGIGGNLLIKGYSPTIILEEGTSYATFDNKTISQCVNEILSDIPGNIMGKKVELDDDKNMGYRVQYKESSFSFLKRIAKTYSLWMYYDGKDLYYGKPSDDAPLELLFGVDITKLKIDLKLIPSEFEYINYNTSSDKIFISSSADAANSNIDSMSDKTRNASADTYTKKIREMVSFRPEAQGDLDNVVKTVKKRLDGRYQIMTGTSSNPDIKLGTIIKIEGPNRANPKERDSYGEYRIISLKQEVSGGGSYSCTFEAISASVLTPPNDVYAGYGLCEDQFAKVKDNKDPQHQGRIRVQFSWQSGETASPWLDCSQIYAGKDRGFYFVPEKDDIVICGFINNNPNLPYVKGSVYRKEHIIPQGEISDENQMKMIRLNADFYLELNEKGKIDGSDAPTLSLANVEGANKVNYLTLGKGSETGIKIYSKDHTISIEGKKMKIESHGDLEIISEGNFSVDSKKDITLKAQGKVSVSATQNIELNSSGGDAKIAGLNVNATAQVGFVAKGNATAELSASGQTVVKGALVMIN